MGTLMLPILQIGPLAIQIPGLLLILGLWLGLTLAERHSYRFHISADFLYNLFFVALLGGLFGARLSYAARFPSAFAASPLSLLSLNPGLFDPLAGAAIGCLAAGIYGQRKGQPFWPVLDALTPLLAVTMVAAAAANLASGNGFGAPAGLPWSIEMWEARRHPSQLYEIAAAGFILVWFWPGRVQQGRVPAGAYFVQFLAATALARLFLEAFRGDSIAVLFGLRSMQLLSWGILAICLLILWQRRNAAPPSRQAPGSPKNAKSKTAGVSAATRSTKRHG